MNSRTILTLVAALLAAVAVAQEALVLNPHGHQDVYLSQGGALKRVVPEYSEIVTSTNYISAAENGTVFYLSATTEFSSYLPAPALGLTYTFIVKTAPAGSDDSSNYKIIAANPGSSANDIIIGKAVLSADAAGDTGTADDTINFVYGQAVAGDRVVVTSDGTKWYAYGHAAVAAGLTFTDAD